AEMSTEQLHHRLRLHPERRGPRPGRALRGDLAIGAQQLNRSRASPGSMAGAANALLADAEHPPDAFRALWAARLNTCGALSCWRLAPVTRKLPPGLTPRPGSSSVTLPRGR